MTVLYSALSIQKVGYAHSNTTSADISLLLSVLDSPLVLSQAVQVYGFCAQKLPFVSIVSYPFSTHKTTQKHSTATLYHSRAFQLTSLSRANQRNCCVHPPSPRAAQHSISAVLYAVLQTHSQTKVPAPSRRLASAPHFCSILPSPGHRPHSLPSPRDAPPTFGLRARHPSMTGGHRHQPHGGRLPARLEQPQRAQRGRLDVSVSAHPRSVSDCKETVRFEHE